MGKEIAGDPQHLDSGLSLQLESQVCNFIQIPVGLLQGGALRGHVPVENRGQAQIRALEYTQKHPKPFHCFSHFLMPFSVFIVAKWL